MSVRKEAEGQLRQVIDTIPTMVWSVLPDGRVEFLNQRWLDYTGLTLSAALEDATRIVHPEDLPRVLDKWGQDMAAGRPSDDAMRLRRADGVYRWFLIRTVPLSDERGNLIRWYGTGTDIESRKRAEDALRESDRRFRQTASQLQGLSRRLVEVQETERKELARELHDRVGQSLTALKINIDVLGSILAPQGSPEAAARLSDSSALLEATMTAIESVVSGLRPPMLDHHGLAVTLEWQAADFARRTGIEVVVRAAEPAVRPPSEVEIALFRIAQEALNNVAKHAHARRVQITLTHTGGECLLSIEDDGVGLDCAAAAPDRPKAGLGMINMRERAEALGGHFEAQAPAGGGTRLLVWIPC